MNVRPPSERVEETRNRIREVSENPSPFPNLKLGASGENIYVLDAVATAIITAFILELVERVIGTDL